MFKQTEAGVIYQDTKTIARVLQFPSLEPAVPSTVFRALIENEAPIISGLEPPTHDDPSPWRQRLTWNKRWEREVNFFAQWLRDALKQKRLDSLTNNELSMLFFETSSYGTNYNEPWLASNMELIDISTTWDTITLEFQSTISQSPALKGLISGINSIAKEELRGCLAVGAEEASEEEYLAGTDTVEYITPVQSLGRFIRERGDFVEQDPYAPTKSEVGLNVPDSTSVMGQPVMHEENSVINQYLSKLRAVSITEEVLDLVDVTFTGQDLEELQKVIPIPMNEDFELCLLSPEDLKGLALIRQQELNELRAIKQQFRRYRDNIRWMLEKGELVYTESKGESFDDEE